MSRHISGKKRLCFAIYVDELELRREKGVYGNGNTAVGKKNVGINKNSCSEKTESKHI